MDAMPLRGKVALITGAARGIGRAIAERFAREGATVGLVDRLATDELAGRMLAEKLSAFPLKVDITDPVAVGRAFDLIAIEWGGIDILVNNAGIIARESILDLSYDTWRKVLDVNVNGAFNCCKAVLPYMIIRRGGRILNITSIAGKMGDITASPVYGASKGALNSFTKSLARQLAEYKVTVNAIAPHAIETDMSAEWSPEKRQAVINAIPLKRMGTAEEVAAAALFLVSGEASFITGEILDLNGGFLMD
jgi:3-oxoacyl-[acyl-carrier protein] reductase